MFSNSPVMYFYSVSPGGRIGGNRFLFMVRWPAVSYVWRFGFYFYSFLGFFYSYFFGSYFFLSYVNFAGLFGCGV